MNVCNVCWQIHTFPWMLDHAHLYLQVPKIGGIQMGTDYPACRTIPLTPEWVTNLWQTQKISPSTAKAGYVRAKKHIRNYLKNIDYHGTCEAERAIAERKQAAEAALLPLQKRAKHIEVVDTVFLLQFSAPMHRCKFLVLTGASCMGVCLFLAGRFQNFHGGSAGQPDVR